MFYLINYPAICDEALSKVFATRPEAYAKVEGGVYIPPMTPSIRKYLENALADCFDAKRDKTKLNIIVHTCQVRDNWRLKHLGSKYMSAIQPGWFRMLEVDKMNVEINHSVFDFMVKFMKEKAQKYLMLEDVDACDITTQFVEKYGPMTTPAKISEARIFIDANTVISHDVAIPTHIKNKITEAIALVVQK